MAPGRMPAEEEVAALQATLDMNEDMIMNMAMNMTMLGLMYAPSDMLTLMGMGMFTHKTMDLNTYQGAMPMNIMGGMRNMNGMGTMGGMSNTSRELLGSFST